MGFRLLTATERAASSLPPGEAPRSADTIASPNTSAQVQPLLLLRFHHVSPAAKLRRCLRQMEGQAIGAQQHPSHSAHAPRVVRGGDDHHIHGWRVTCHNILVIKALFSLVVVVFVAAVGDFFATAIRSPIVIIVASGSNFPINFCLLLVLDHHDPSECYHDAPMRSACGFQPAPCGEVAQEGGEVGQGVQCFLDT